MDFLVDIHAHGHFCLVFIYLKKPNNSKDGRICPSHFSSGRVLLGENTYLHLTKKKIALYMYDELHKDTWGKGG